MPLCQNGLVLMPADSRNLDVLSSLCSCPRPLFFPFLSHDISVSDNQFKHLDITNDSNVCYHVIEISWPLTEYP